MEAKINNFYKLSKYTKVDAINQMFKKITPNDFSHINKMIYEKIETSECNDVIINIKEKYNNLTIKDISHNNIGISEQVTVNISKISVILKCTEYLGLHLFTIVYYIHGFLNEIQFTFTDEHPTIKINYIGSESFSDKKISKYFLLIMCKIMRLAVENKMLIDTSMMRYFTEKIMDDKTLIELFK